MSKGQHGAATARASGLRAQGTPCTITVSVEPCPLDGVDVAAQQPDGQASGFIQRCGSSSSIRLFGWLGSRSSTSRR